MFKMQAQALEAYSTKIKKKEFLNYIHHFRGLAILFIVGLHTIMVYPWSGLYDQKKIVIILFNNGTVLFVFIAGYLFFHLNKDNFNYKDYLRKKFLYVILPYLFISVPALFDKFYFDKVGDHWWFDERYAAQAPLSKLLYLLSSGYHLGVLWFIPMITVIYVMAPVIRRFAQAKVFLFIVPVIVFLGLFTFRFGYHANIFISLQYFLPVYLFGIWVYRMKETLFKHATKILYALGVIWIAFNLFEYVEWIPFNKTLELRDVTYTIYQFNFNKFKMHLFAIFALLLFYQLNEKQITVLRILGDFSFGVFFIHLYVLMVLRLAMNEGYFSFSYSNVFAFFIFFGLVMFITVGIVKIVKIVFKDSSRYLIGS